MLSIVSGTKALFTNCLLYASTLLHWFRHYLSDRKQRVVIVNSSSSWEDIYTGVPQWSSFGHLLFLIFINDIVEGINSNIILFANDTILYIIVDSPDTSAKTVISTQYIFGPKHCSLPSIKLKRNLYYFRKKWIKVDHPSLLMDTTTIPSVNNHKHLGLTLSEDAKWKDHITLTLNKAWQRIGILRTLKFVVNRSSLEKMYFCFIRPTLEYADVLWDNCTNALKQDIEDVQIEAARTVTGATKLCNTQHMLSEYWPSHRLSW